MLNRAVAPAYRALLQRDTEMERGLQRVRRKLLLAQIRYAADRVGATVDADISLDVTLGRRIRIDVWPGRHTVLRVAPHVRIGDDVRLGLNGGTLELGDWCELRHRCILNVSGHLEMTQRNALSYGSTVHCAEHVRLEPMVGASEYVTITDCSHHFSERDVYFYENLRTAPVRIERNTWLCAGAVVTRGVTIGDHCIVAANSVVTSDVPAGHLATGVPATSRSLGLPWIQALDADPAAATRFG